MTTQEIIKHYNIQYDEYRDIIYTHRDLSAADKAVIKAARADILAALKAAADEAEAARKAAREQLLANVPGLDILEQARADWSYYRDRCDAEMDREDGIWPQAPQSDLTSLRAQYPAAAAYLKAEAYWLAANDRKSAAGRKAMESIAVGEDWQTVLERMEAEWSAATGEHIWD